MKKTINYFLFTFLILLSFYFTEKTAILLRNNDPLMNNIKSSTSKLNTTPINATINDEYIIPGLYGKKINEVKSLMNMKEQNVFNELFLVTDYIKPDISLNDNKDKIITMGNPNKKSISLVLSSYNNNQITYLNSKKISYSILINKESFISDATYEQINDEPEDYNKVEKYLKNNNKNICLIYKLTKSFCQSKNKYIVETSNILGKSNLIEIKNNLTSGSIIIIKEEVPNKIIDSLINYIISKNLKIISLSDLISEK